MENDWYTLAERFMKGEFNNNPIVQRINNMLAGKPDPEQIRVLLNMLQSSGIDINKKLYIPDEIARRFGLIP